MASQPITDIADYPRPWFYRPEVYYGFFIFPPVWSILTLRSPWHKAEGFLGIMVGGVAWFFLIASVVMSVKWVQEGGVLNLFIFVPGILLTLLTQVQWAAHRSRHGPPPTADSDDGTEASSRPADSTHTPRAAPVSPARPPRRRRRRRQRPAGRSGDGPADSPTLC